MRRVVINGRDVKVDAVGYDSWPLLEQAFKHRNYSVPINPIMPLRKLLDIAETVIFEMLNIHRRYEKSCRNFYHECQDYVRLLCVARLIISMKMTCYPILYFHLV